MHAAVPGRFEVAAFHVEPRRISQPEYSRRGLVHRHGGMPANHSVAVDRVAHPDLIAGPLQAPVMPPSALPAGSFQPVVAPSQQFTHRLVPPAERPRWIGLILPHDAYRVVYRGAAEGIALYRVGNVGEGARID